ncbi:alpha/beta hydrolase [Nocardia asteroides NBRC 15531]|uniref:2-hydroxy-6-oxo-7-methylocta-2,4-dienoate hydrolase n=1 Tax=Nocardia asteroides NBRC 15531 TaxID=1110697 RepID=U5ELD2_NOCAS|nr:alpha/beta hydrolase [Nocardia asteroides]TLF63410.1 alpha/beta hydrolase [Nocardia asteroides NBRC 15531]UGT47155.1 alpha/beta hydrolase [Nocardia asteroides]SFM77989.1 Pimeloyl-ACP methyl ester carboxylesterase [Nocardia asteroides]VEG33965.1 Haloalkane dehalogenase [Nocardia asteroides]GAD87123.1 putative 2-hydroxy-6-oxo-7-methylocta-2,4-dienoate hydrolase [Nocardia asteroides NBRC 15531]
MSQIRHNTVQIQGQTVFYREAGDPNAPTVVLLHGFPTSSAMFRNLIPELAADYHVIAPDHLGFGQSAMPAVDEFDYTFDKLTEITLELLDTLGVDRFALYIQDYGAPIGLRIASAHPERITALITQSGNAYLEGFTPFWEVLFAHANDRATHEPEVRKLLDLDATKWQYTHGVPADRLALVSPDTWTLDQAYLDRPGNKEIQLQLFADYKNNLDGYPGFQKYFAEHRPPTLITWGEHDEIFGADGARAYLRDLPDAELHLLDAGHFALESHGPEIAALIRDFLGRILR